MSSANVPFTDSRVIAETLSRLRRLIRRYISVQGLVLLGIWLIGFFWIAGLLDYLPVWLGAEESPLAVRVVFLLLGIGVGIYILVRFVLSPLLVRWPDRAVALLLERKFPSLESSLVTFVENRNLTKDREGSSLAQGWKLDADERLRQQIAIQAESRLKEIDLDDVLKWDPLRLQCGILGALVAASVLASVAMPNWTSLWSKRLLALSDVSWPRKSELSVRGLQISIPNFTGETDRNFYEMPFENNQVTVPFGQNSRLLATASLKADEVPAFCTVNYRMADGQTGRANLRRLPVDRLEQQQPFLLEGPPLDSIHQDIELSLRGGDVRISGLRIQSLPAVEFVNMDLAVIYPPYLRQRSTSTALDGVQAYRNGIRLPEGVDITLQIKSNSELSRCEYRVMHQSAEQKETSGSISIMSDAFELPLGVLRENVLIEFRPWDSLGHAGTDVKQYVITIVKDQLPNADFRLEGIGNSVTPLARLPFQVNVRDDHDVKSVDSQLLIGDKDPMKDSIQLNKSLELTGEIDLRELRDKQNIVIEPGTPLMLLATVTDYFDLDDSSRTGSSSPAQLTVVTEDQLLVLLDRRELDLRNRLEQIIIELNRLTELLSRNLESNTEAPTSDEAQPAEENSDEGNSNRMVLVRVQEAKIQVEKSNGELSGIANQTAAINKELVNNRIDSADRQVRLEEKVRLPIQSVLDNELAELDAKLKTIENSLRDNTYELSQMNESVALNLAVISRLNEVLQSLLDIQDFNEVVDMVRDMLQKEEELIDRTKEEQKRRALELFK